MMKLARILFPFLIISLCSACSDDIPDPDFRASLHGTWVMNRVAVSGFGYFEGTSAISFDHNGGYRSDVYFSDPNSGCEVFLYYAGTFEATGNTITSQISRGEVEISGCNEATGNSTRDYTQEELDAASTTAEYVIIGNTLELITNQDDFNRIFVKQ